jgi:hypothetical protein
VATATPPKFHESETFYSPLKKKRKTPGSHFPNGAARNNFLLLGAANNRHCMQWALEVLFSTAHTIQTRGCSHFTTVFGHTAAPCGPLRKGWFSLVSAASDMSMQNLNSSTLQPVSLVLSTQQGLCCLFHPVSPSVLWAPCWTT